MTTTDCINLFLGISMFMVTGVLAWATWRYMVATKRMADSIGQQALMMQKEFEVRISPLVEEFIEMDEIKGKSAKVKVRIMNVGSYAIHCTSIESEIYKVGEIKDAVKFSHTIDKWIPAGTVIETELILHFDLVIALIASEEINKSAANLLFRYESASGIPFAHCHTLDYC